MVSCRLLRHKVVVVFVFLFDEFHGNWSNIIRIYQSEFPLNISSWSDLIQLTYRQDNDRFMVARDRMWLILEFFADIWLLVIRDCMCTCC